MSVNAPVRETLAIDGGQPVRETLLPYGRQSIDEDDIQAVVETLRSDWLTTGPKVGEFEEAFAAWVGAKHAISFSSGTAALHAAAFAAGLQPGDEAITSPLTFAATANCLLYQGARPVFADVSPDSLTLDPEQAGSKITSRTRAIVPVDYAGHPADLDSILRLAERYGLVVIEDACHALGAEYRGRRIGSISHMTVFSFHPVKHLTTGEGGMVTTENAEFAKTLRCFRNHGISSDARHRQAVGQWHYEMVLLGFNYRLTDIACALGLQQLKKLGANLSRRKQIAARYDAGFREIPEIICPAVRPEVNPAWHLYPIRLDLNKLNASRGEIFRAMRAENIGVNVHYIPVHLHPYYRDRFGYQGGEFPVAENAYQSLISLPMFHGMNDGDVEDVIQAVRKVVDHYSS
ncbi:MAG: UDP-4-amino-4,6-dideoxy-N-acetyl-beta-L-altrosamine transaminase [Acidobacteria bacterium]|nr:MAG: UDP-4-amino-4,6-dideoxy-N-acetyl-beta-L-altrosamine transaminase [Acidobacteriota bacterium]